MATQSGNRQHMDASILFHSASTPLSSHLLMARSQCRQHRHDSLPSLGQVGMPSHMPLPCLSQHLLPCVTQQDAHDVSAI